MEITTVVVLVTAFGLSTWRPHFGVAIFAALLPVEAVLPGGLMAAVPLLGSPLAAVGAMAAAGAGLRLISRGELTVQQVLGDPVKLLGLLFALWVLVTHPATTWSVSDGRNWAFTFIQLWTLFIVGGAALNTQRKLMTVMTLYAVACVVSTAVAVAGGSIAEIRDLERSTGLTIGANAAARYFVVGAIFLYYLGIVEARTTPVRLAASAAAACLVVGVVFTQSRAGILLAVLALMFIAMMSIRRHAAQLAGNAVVLVIVGVLLFPEGALPNIGLWFAPEAVDPGARLAGVQGNMRLHVWDAGMQMWRDNPIAGVGIGNFREHSAAYLSPSVRLTEPGIRPHNTFMGLLSETGIVGLGLFLLMVLACLHRSWRTVRSQAPRSTPALAAWMAAVVLLLLGGLVKDETASKLLWLGLGVLAYAAPNAAATLAHWRGRNPETQDLPEPVWRPGVVTRIGDAGSEAPLRSRTTS